MKILNVNNANRRWYEIIIWWEIRRIPYNVIMYLVGSVSFYIGFVTLPLLYIVIGVTLNVLYTCCWIIELFIISRIQNENLKLRYAKLAFISYLLLSSLLVFGFAFLLVLYRS